VLAAAMAAAAALLLWLQRDLTFVPDEIYWIQLVGAKPAGDFLHPYFGNLLALPYLLYRAVLELFGTDYTAFGAVQVGGLLLCCGLMFEYARRRVGALLALAPAIVLLFLGSSRDVLLQPLIGAQWLYSLAFGLGALLALERGDRRGDVAGCALLTLSVLWFSSGVAFLAGAAVAVLLAPRARQRAWIVLVPALPYAAWRIWALKFGGGPEFSLDNLPFSPLYVADAAAAAAAGIFGRIHLVGSGPGASLHLEGFELGDAAKSLAIVAVEVVALVLVARVLRRRRPLPATLWVALAVPVALWLTQSFGLAVNRTPGENRYLFAGVFVLLLLLVECARGVRLSRAGTAAVFAVAAVAVLGNVPRFRDARRILVPYAEKTRSQMAVIELAGRRADPSFLPAVDAHGVAPLLIMTVGPWLEVIDRYGSPALPLGELAGQDESVREASDGLLARLLELRLRPVGPVALAGACGPAKVRTGAGGVPLPAGGATLSAARGARVELGRFAARPSAFVGRVGAQRLARLAIPHDRSPVPWRLYGPPGAAIGLC
jgi:hypothetical protein